MQRVAVGVRVVEIPAVVLHLLREVVGEPLEAERTAFDSSGAVIILRRNSILQPEKSRFPSLIILIQ